MEVVPGRSRLRSRSGRIRPGYKSRGLQHWPRFSYLPAGWISCGLSPRQGRALQATAHRAGMRFHPDGLDRGRNGDHHDILARWRILWRWDRLCAGLSAHHPGGRDMRIVDGEKKSNGACRGRLALGNRNGSPHPDGVPCPDCCQGPSLLTLQLGECAPRPWRIGRPSGARRQALPLRPASQCW